MDAASELDRGLRALRPPPADVAAVEQLVLRLPGEARETPTRLRLDPEAGAVGDRWAASLVPKIDAQVTLMRADVARLLGDPPAFGDNLLVTIDTGATNLPPGTVLRVGSARCVVTPKPHTGCAKFARRSSDVARAVLASADWRPAQLRGVHLRVLEAGDVAVGDAVRVESRP